MRAKKLSPRKVAEMSDAISTPEDFKEKAKLIRKFMKEKCNADISHSYCLELSSQLFGFKDWNTASAVSKTKGRLPTYIKTVGQIKKILAKFDDSAGFELWGLNGIAGLIDVIKTLSLKDEFLRNHYSLIFCGADENKPSFQLKLEEQRLLDADLKEIENEWRNTGICNL